MFSLTRLPLNLTVVVACLSSAATCAAGDWPQWLGPTRNGVSTESVAPWTGDLKPAWGQAVGNGFSVPVVADGKLYVHAAVDGKDAEVVQAFDAETGTPLWRDEYAREAYQSELGAGPRATPTIANGRLYTIGITGVLSCYDAASGQRLWQTNPYVDLKATRPGFGVCASPLVIGDRLILPVGGEGSGVVGYDVVTGQIAWKIFDEPAAAASPILLTRGGSDAPPQAIVQSTLRLAGINLVDPVDDMHAGNPASHPKLLDELAAALRDSGFDLDLLYRGICLSEAYQRSSAAATETDPHLFTSRVIKPMTGEQFTDSLLLAIGRAPPAGKVQRGDDATRRRLIDLFATHGALRDPESSVVQALALMNGSLVEDAVDPQESPVLAALITDANTTDVDAVSQLVLRTYSRPPTDDELQTLVAYVQSGGAAERARRLGDLFWTLLNSAEFRWNH